MKALKSFIKARKSAQVPNIEVKKLMSVDKDEKSA